MPGIGFIRVKLLQCEKGEGLAIEGETFDPYIAVNVKEAVHTPGKTIKLFLCSLIKLSHCSIKVQSLRRRFSCFLFHFYT